jgi:hypothetical protein
LLRHGWNTPDNIVRDSASQRNRLGRGGCGRQRVAAASYAGRWPASRSRAVERPLVPSRRRCDRRPKRKHYGVLREFAPCQIICVSQRTLRRVNYRLTQKVWFFIGLSSLGCICGIVLGDYPGSFLRL